MSFPGSSPGITACELYSPVAAGPTEACFADSALREPAAERRRRRNVVAGVFAVAGQCCPQHLPRDAVVVVEVAALVDEAADRVVLGAVAGGRSVDRVAASEPGVLPLEAALDEPGEDPFGLSGELVAQLGVFPVGEGDAERNQPDAIPDRSVGVLISAR